MLEVIYNLLAVSLRGAVKKVTRDAERNCYNYEKGIILLWSSFAQVDLDIEVFKKIFKRNVQFFSKFLTDEQNKEIFGKCNHINGHGHNYTAEVSVRGPVDRTTGMVMNLTDLKEIMKHCIMLPLDHRNIDKDVDYFKNVPSTAENIAVYIWDSVILRLAKPELLFEVKLYETDKNFVSYKGEMTKIPPLNRRVSENICANMSSDSE